MEALGVLELVKKVSMKLWQKVSPTTIRKLLIVVGGLTVLCGFACGVTEISTDEERVVKLNKTLMCPVCPGESIDQSQNQLAGFMRELVSKKVEDGLTDEDIKQYFADRYGPSVLLDPPVEGFTAIAWAVPPTVAVIVVIALYIALKLMSRNSKTSRMNSEPSGVRQKHVDFVEEELKRM